MKPFFPCLLLVFSISNFAQKKVLDHADVELWNTIKDDAISPNGNLVVYNLQKENVDSHLILKNTDGTTVFEYERASKGQFSHDSQFLTFSIKPWKDSIDDMQRRKVKKDKLPKDSLGIFNIATKELVKLPNLKSYSFVVDGKRSACNGKRGQSRI